MKNPRLIFTLELCLFIFSALLFTSLVAYATTFENPLPAASVPTLTGRIIKAFLGIVGSIALVLFIYAGLTWMLAKGDSAKIKTASKTMAWTAIGLAVIFFSYTMLFFVLNVFNK